LLTHAPELHIDMVVVVLVYQLKVLDTGLVDSAIEVEYEGLDLFVPFGWLIEEEHDSFCVINLELLLNRLIFIS